MKVIPADSPRTAPPVPVTMEPRAGLVKPFAVLGALSLAVGFTAWTRWIFSPDFHATPTGPDEFSTSRLVVLRAFEFGSLAIALALVWHFLAKPLIKERTFTLDGMIIVAGLTNYWMDPLVNYFNFTVAYNAHGLNFGSWTKFIPGWLAPNQQLFPEPVLGISTTWIWWVFGSAYVGCVFLRWLKARRPETTFWQLMAACFALFFLLDLFIEFSIVYFIQIWTYPGTVHSWTIFADRWYQFPIYEPILIGIFGTGIAVVRYCRDDKGRSFVERGVDDLKVGPKAKKLASFLAITGWLHVAVSIIGYTIPYSYFALHADTFPAMPSYLRAGICGEGTTYACPSKDHVPLPSRSSLHLGPDDPGLPPSVRERQGLSR